MKQKIYENLVRAVRADIVEKLKTFSLKGLAGDLDVPYGYITWLSSSQSSLWFQVPKFYIYVLAIKLTIAVPAYLQDDKVEEFTKRNVKFGNDGNKATIISFNKSRQSGSRKKKKDSVVPKVMKKTAKEPIEKPPTSKPSASFDMKPKGDKIPDLSDKSSAQGPDNKPVETKGKEMPGSAGIPSASQAQTVPAKKYPDHDSFDKLCQDLRDDLAGLITKIHAIELAYMELNFLDDKEKGFLFDILISELRKTFGEWDKNLPKEAKEDRIIAR